MRREEGFTLIELLVASTLMILVLGTTLTTFEAFTRSTNRNQDQNDAASAARTALDRMAKNMRNQAAPASDQQYGIEKATSYDVVFQSVDATKPSGSANVRNIRRIRYCLDTTNPNNEQIWSQTQTWTTAATPAAPATTACPDPDPAWATQRVFVDHLTNRVSGQDRPVWTFNNAQLSHISTIRTLLYVDRDPTRAPPEQVLSTTTYLRNENQAPIAQFTYLVNANGSVVLNATGSTDPEGERVTCVWSEGSTAIGQGLAFTWDNVSSGSHTVTLTVSDPTGLTDSTSQVVNVP